MEGPWPNWVWWVGVVVAAVAAGWWPLSVRGHVLLDVLRGEGRIQLAAAPGRLVVGTVGRVGGEFDVVVEMWLFHRWPLRLSLVRQAEKTADADAGEGLRKGGDGAETGGRVASDGPEVPFPLNWFADLWRSWGPAVGGAGDGLRFALQGATFGRWSVAATVGMGDAARTARACGWLWAAFGVASARLQRLVRWRGRPFWRVRPAYNRWRFRIEAEGVVRLVPWRLAAAAGVGFAAFWRRRRQLAMDVGGTAFSAENV